MTNGDRIREILTDDKLVELMSFFTELDAEFGFECQDPCNEYGCEACRLEWLQTECVGDGDEDKGLAGDYQKYL